MRLGAQRHALAALPPGKTRYPLYRRLGEPQGRSGRVRKTSLPTGFDPRTVQPVASHYTDWAIPAHESLDGVQVNCVAFQLLPRTSAETCGRNQYYIEVQARAIQEKFCVLLLKCTPDRSCVHASCYITSCWLWQHCADLHRETQLIMRTGFVPSMQPSLSTAVKCSYLTFFTMYSHSEKRWHRSWLHQDTYVTYK